jgi:hypothetical protein
MGRYFTLPGWPARVLGHSAATPTMTRPPGSAWQYKDGITGRPGTVKVLDGTPGVPTGPIAQAMGGTSYTAYCPGFYPNQYWARPEASYRPGAGMPIAVRSDNLMPVPARDPRGVPAPQAVPSMLRGGRQIRQPARVVSWPGVNDE